MQQIVVDATATFQQGINSVSELELENVNGTFQSGEKIEATSNETDTKITFTVKSVITGTSLDNDGILHSLSEALVIDSDKGNGFADVLVDTIKEGSVSSVHIENANSAYEVGDKVNFTGGTGITAEPLDLYLPLVVRSYLKTEQVIYKEKLEQ